MASIRLAAAMKFIEHFATLDTNILQSILATDYIHQYAPSSIPQQEPFDKQGLIAFVTSLKTIMNGYPMVVKLAMESESSNAVTIWAAGEAIFRDAAKDDGIANQEWNYKAEYIFMIFLDNEGDKIIKTIELVDSKATVDKLLGLSQRAYKNISNQSSQ
ncbi:hypothetical protein PFICI_09970 [Pestalotiopsis fici W106-1]|uniref:SnoaL-like domain-containing protein n=1 Tax=Pestalotiopsis fici (strain W106-1 / CGMCC3.15140) TaxID=1229662 RepID=W3WVK9_PESFW|nr:uncharacterized protein PFICI_09970 [Pestalotiopsis fici W106-1]ETS77908.1 hypothetical protein PFICI_09970 [Pestalotiopsis fici W106-1]